MGLEIERKFLISEPKIIEIATNSDFIRQGYLSLDIDRTVRVRSFNGSAAWITVKGRNKGAVRSEFEYRIPECDGLELLNMCVGGYIEKVRYIIPYKDLIVEVDVFAANNNGLVVAEIEFEEGDERATMPWENLKHRLPPWIESEVTDDPRYYNSALITTPYSFWNT